MNPAGQEDLQLLALCLAGDRSASERFVRKFSNLVYKSVQMCFLNRSVQYCREDLEDLHNTVFVNLFDRQAKKLRQFGGKNGCSLASWIRMITVRLVLDHFRKKGFDSFAGRNFMVPLESLSEIHDNTSESGKILEAQEGRQLLCEAVENLSAREQLLIKFHVEQGLDLTEISELMGITVENSYTIKSRAVKKMKDYLAER